MIKENSKIISVCKLSLNKLQKYKEEEYNKIRSDLELIVEVQKSENKPKRPTLRLYRISYSKQ